MWITITKCSPVYKEKAEQRQRRQRRRQHTEGSTKGDQRDEVEEKFQNKGYLKIITFFFWF